MNSNGNEDRNRKDDRKKDTSGDKKLKQLSVVLNSGRQSRIR
jgi:hypothetical protein